MTTEQISKALTQGGRVAARYRDPYGFIISGVILSVEGEKVFIDNLKNSVMINNVISIKHI